LNNPKYTQSARRFAVRYSNFDPKIQQAQMLQRVLELLERPAGKAAETPTVSTALAGAV
jgi:hypothetical protein